MCSDAGSDASVESEVSESTAEADESTELCETNEIYENDEASQELVEGNDSQLENSPTENEPETQEKNDVQDFQDGETTDKTDDSETEIDEEAVRAEINEKSEYSDEVNENISSVDELEVYQKANLKEENVDGKTCLIRDDIDMDYVDPKTGNTNRELMEKGRAPYDAQTGERIELHHIGQNYESPLAELTEDSEHGKCHSTLHTKDGESWRNDSQKNNHYNNVERPGHWRARAKGD